MFCFQAEDGIRDLVRSRGLGDVYKRQSHWCVVVLGGEPQLHFLIKLTSRVACDLAGNALSLSLIHI